MGGFSLASALKVAYLRGKFASSLVKKNSTRWGMLAVDLRASDIQPYVDAVLDVMISKDKSDHLHTSLTIACVNSLKSVTISGRVDLVDVIEAGPHSTLQGPLRDILAQHTRRDAVSYFSVPKRQDSPIVTALNLLGKLYCKGYPVNLTKANNGTKHTKGSRQ